MKLAARRAREHIRGPLSNSLRSVTDFGPCTRRFRSRGARTGSRQPRHTLLIPWLEPLPRTRPRVATIHRQLSLPPTSPLRALVLAEQEGDWRGGAPKTAEHRRTRPNGAFECAPVYFLVLGSPRGAFRTFRRRFNVPRFP